MTKFLSQRVPRFVVLALLCLAISSTLYLPVAEAFPKNGHDCTFYSDASYTTEVGACTLGCGEGHGQVGTVSHYSICVFWCCDCTPTPPE